MHMEIRSYTDDDWQAVRDIYDRSKPDEMRGSVNLSAIPLLERDPDHLALFRDSSILVMEDASEILGFAGHNGNYISWVYVHPAHRRSGVATALVREILGRLDGTVTLNVARNNHAARALYLRLGFVVAKEFRTQFNGHDVEAMTLSYDKA
jgi:ribosomal protein S18 acetylase RimI-like enzyme